MLLDNEKIESENEFKAVAAANYKEFERLCEYIKTMYLKGITSTFTNSSKRDQLVHKYNNLDEAINIVSNAVKDTAPTLNI
ncbi:hypothetical protein MLN87_07405 [Escherichia coli]|nr:hypothetical protein [Escherichia coli]MCN8204090.1 hypothetical protein [Escherichia coli]HAI3384512.1 hypothetical protein [Escherichia coli]HAL0004650.1 hypothetical protein [Escherichia coli]HAP1523992.1 hypothetical protein [Escherichia coli]